MDLKKIEWALSETNKFNDTVFTNTKDLIEAIEVLENIAEQVLQVGKEMPLFADIQRKLNVNYVTALKAKEYFTIITCKLLLDKDEEIAMLKNRTEYICKNCLEVYNESQLNEKTSSVVCKKCGKAEVMEKNFYEILIRDEEIENLKQEIERINAENNTLWAIYKTCIGCKNCPTDGTVYGCYIQKYINLSGTCNQKES